MLTGNICALGFVSGGGVSFSVTDLGIKLDGGVAASFSISGATVPAGSLIILIATENNAAGTIGTVSDSAGNTYTSLGALNPNATATNGVACAFYKANCSALSSGTITYTKSGANTNRAGIGAFYSISAATTTPLDAAVTASATGTGTAPSVTSGTPGVAGELFVAYAITVNGGTFTQVTGWTTPYDAMLSNPQTHGGHRINQGTGTLTYNPTFGTSSAWCTQIFSFKHK